ILERLADLIRPALAWRAGSGARPEGAYDGATFMVTPAMMSILGATADDMEEILKGLGYRAEARPAAEVQAKLDAFDTAAREQAAARAEAEAAASVEAEPATESEEAAAAADAGAAASVEAEPATASEEAAATADAEAAAVEDDTAKPDADSVEDDAAKPAEAVAEVAETTNAVAEEPAAQPVAEPEEVTVAVEPDAAAAAPSEEPKPILLWRPARFEGRQRHGQGRDRGNAQQRGPRRNGEAQEGASRGDRPERGKFRGKPGERGGQRGERRDGDKRREGGGKPPFGERPRGDRQQDRPQQKPREERPAKLDPDSPFAKLAALREQLSKK